MSDEAHSYQIAGGLCETPANKAARGFWPMAVTERPYTVRCSTTAIAAAGAITHTASTGTPDTCQVANSARAGGGLILIPRP